MSGTDALLDEIDALKAKVAEQEELIKRINRLSTDRMYTILAYYNMLGEKGRQVADMWEKKGVKRVHFSWGPEAYKKSGEERAQFILDLEEKLKDAVPVENIDG